MDNPELKVEIKKNLQEKLRENFNTIKRLKGPQKTSLGFIVLLVLLLPVWVTLSLNRISSRSSRADNPATPVTPPNPTPTGFSQAISLDGASFLTVSNSNSLNPQLGFTAEAWFKPRNPVFSSRIINRMSGSLNSFSIFASSQQDISTGNYIVEYSFGVVNSGNNCAFHTIRQQQIIVSSEVEKITSWHHIAGVVQPDGKMDIFVDGQRSTTNFGQITGICSRSLPIQVGARDFGNGSADGYFNGELDEVRISSISRYSDNFNLPTSPFTTDSNTLVLYHFDNNLTDSSGNTHDGLVTGNIQYVNSTVPIPITPTPIPTAIPTPIVYLNSSTGKNCNTVCSSNSYSCVSVGTDTNGSNSKYWQVSKNSCVESPATCTTIMKKAANKTCSGNRSPWTYCQCK